MLCHATVILLLLLLLLYTPQHRYCFYYSCTLVLLACTPATTLCIPASTTLCIPTATTPILLYSYHVHIDTIVLLSYTH